MRRRFACFPVDNCCTNLPRSFGVPASEHVSDVWYEKKQVVSFWSREYRLVTKGVVIPPSESRAFVKLRSLAVPKIQLYSSKPVDSVVGAGIGILVEQYAIEIQ